MIREMSAGCEALSPISLPLRFSTALKTEEFIKAIRPAAEALNLYNQGFLAIKPG